MAPQPIPVMLLDGNDSTNLQIDSVFRSPWSAGQEIDFQSTGGHLPLCKRNSTPVRFAAPSSAQIISTTNQDMPQQQVPYHGVIPGPLVGNHFAPKQNTPHMNDMTLSNHRRLDRSMSEPGGSTQMSHNIAIIQNQTNVSVAPPPTNAMDALKHAQDQANQQAAQTAQASSRYKTELCRPFAETGYCKYGEKCQFAHGGVDLRSMARHPKYKTELCRTFHTTGLCGYGTRCHFIHNADERRTPSSNSEPAPVMVQPPPMVPNNMPHMLQHTRHFIEDEYAMKPPHPQVRQLNMGPSPPSSFHGSPTNPAGSFFDDTFTFGNDLFSAFQAQHQTEIPLSLLNIETPPVSPLGSHSGVSPVESLSGDLDSLSISPAMSGSPIPNHPWTNSNDIPTASNNILQAQNYAGLASLSDSLRHFRLPIFETLAES